MIRTLILRIPRIQFGGDFYGVRERASEIAGTYTKYVRTILRAMTMHSGKSDPKKKLGGVFSGGVPPDSIPNSEVKPACGDDSAEVARCQNSTMPPFYIKKPRSGFFTTRSGFLLFKRSICKVRKPESIRIFPRSRVREGRSVGSSF